MPPRPASSRSRSPRRGDAVDAVVLSGGSAFGLAAADGVMAWCEEHDRGVPTVFGRVPIVVGMSLYRPRRRRRLGPSRCSRWSGGRLISGNLRARGRRVRRRRHGREMAWPRPGGRRRSASARSSPRATSRWPRSIAVNAVGDVIGHGRSHEPWPDPGAGLPSPTGVSGPARPKRCSAHPGPVRPGCPPRRGRMRSQTRRSASWPPTPRSTRSGATTSPGPPTTAWPGHQSAPPGGRRRRVRSPVVTPRSRRRSPRPPQVADRHRGGTGAPRAPRRRHLAPGLPSAPGK